MKADEAVKIKTNSPHPVQTDTSPQRQQGTCESVPRWRVGLVCRVISMTLPGLLAFATAMSPGCRKIEPAPLSDPLTTENTESGVDMVLVQGGSFQMGSAAEDQIDETPHAVHIDSFYMDKYEVTQEEYERVVGTNPSRWKGEGNPVEQIRWKDAIEYCNARSRLEGLQPAYDEQTWQCDFEADGYRLPTEAEWEYAARAGTSTAFSFGGDRSKLDRHAWFKANCTRGPHPVGQKEPNPWGLYDMYGNVWEWCHDFYHEDYYQQSPDKNPRGPDSGETRVVRGGCWNSKPDMCRSSYRYYEDPAFTDICFAKEIHGMVGFRCVRRRSQK